MISPDYVGILVNSGLGGRGRRKNKPLSGRMEAALSESGVVSIVHSGGRDEYYRPVKTEEIMLKHPRHYVATTDVLRYPTGVISPDLVLMPGNRFFLVPFSSVWSIFRRSGCYGASATSTKSCMIKKSSTASPQAATYHSAETNVALTPISNGNHHRNQHLQSPHSSVRSPGRIIKKGSSQRSHRRATLRKSRLSNVPEEEEHPSNSEKLHDQKKWNRKGRNYLQGGHKAPTRSITLGCSRQSRVSNVDSMNVVTENGRSEKVSSSIDREAARASKRRVKLASNLNDGRSVERSYQHFDGQQIENLLRSNTANKKRGEKFGKTCIPSRDSLQKHVASCIGQCVEVTTLPSPDWQEALQKSVVLKRSKIPENVGPAPGSSQKHVIHLDLLYRNQELQPPCDTSRSDSPSLLLRGEEISKSCGSGEERHSKEFLGGGSIQKQDVQHRWQHLELLERRKRGDLCDGFICPPRRNLHRRIKLGDHCRAEERNHKYHLKFHQLNDAVQTNSRSKACLGHFGRSNPPACLVQNDEVGYQIPSLRQLDDNGDLDISEMIPNQNNTAKRANLPYDECHSGVPYVRKVERTEKAGRLQQSGTSGRRNTTEIMWNTRKYDAAATASNTCSDLSGSPVQAISLRGLAKIDLKDVLQDIRMLEDTVSDGHDDGLPIGSIDSLSKQSCQPVLLPVVFCRKLCSGRSKRRRGPWRPRPVGLA